MPYCGSIARAKSNGSAARAIWLKVGRASSSYMNRLALVIVSIAYVDELY
jgi:hypothetical protein